MNESLFQAIEKENFSISCISHALDWLNEGVLLIEARKDLVGNKIIYANKRFVEMVGYTSEELIGRGSHDFYDQSSFEALQEKVRKMDEFGRNQYEFFLPCKDGSKIPTINSSQIIQETDDYLIVVVTFTDITEQKRIQHELEIANKRLRTYQEKIADDLHLAEEVQHLLIPAKQRVGSVQIDTRYIPMIGIGGDYVYARKVEDNKMYLTVCDVVGHGIAAALVASYIQSRVSRILSESVVGPDDLIQQLNLATQKLLRPKTLFFTFAAVEIDTEKKVFRAACAGHPPVYHVHSDGKLNEINGPFPIMGIFHPLPKRHEIEEIPLEAGDRIVLYTDGITEARTPEKDAFYGQDRFKNLLVMHHDKSGEQLCEIIQEDLSKHTQDIYLDDVTLLVASIDKNL